MSIATVEILEPFKYFKKGQIINVAEAAAASLVEKGIAAYVLESSEMEVKEKPKKSNGKESV